MSPRPPPKISLRHDHDWTRKNDDLGSTVAQQPVGKLVQQSFGEALRVKLSKPTQSKPNPICDRSELVQQSCGEVQHLKISKPTQPKPKPICDRSGKLEKTEDVFVVKGETSRSHEIGEKGLHEELGSSDRSGKPEKLSENTVLSMLKMEQGNLGSSSSAHTVKEQFAPEENRDIVSCNADNEFNRAIDEENIDFNIPGVHSAVRPSQCENVQNLIQKIENHRQALQSDLQQHRQFNPFSKESQT